jgi:hypothetical protein
MKARNEIPSTVKFTQFMKAQLDGQADMISNRVAVSINSLDTRLAAIEKQQAELMGRMMLMEQNIAVLMATTKKDRMSTAVSDPVQIKRTVVIRNNTPENMFTDEVSELVSSEW